MEYIDLTHPFRDTMPVFPGDPSATLTETLHVVTDGCADHLVHSGMHVGTHIDAPAHMLAGGATIDAFPLTATHTRGVVIDAQAAPVLTRDVFAHASIEKGMTVVVATGWSARFRTDTYFDFTRMPLLTAEAATYLVERAITCLVLDTPTPDVAPFPQHKILLNAGIYIVENAHATERLIGKGGFECVIVPSAFVADAAPVRMYARIFGRADVPLGRYRHYKGGEYIVKSIAKHSETLEPLVVYESSEGHGTWVRPLSMFAETMLVDGVPVRRFERIGE
jgi:kynurenine formamidase